MNAHLPIKRFKLYRTNDNDSGFFWRLEIKGVWVRLFEENGDASRFLYQFHVRRSREYFQLPSFWENRAKYSLILSDEIVELDLSTAGENAIQELVERSLVFGAPDTVMRTVVAGAVQAMLGFGLALVAIYVSQEANREAKVAGKEGFTIWTGGILMGCIWGCWGLFLFTRVPRLHRISKEIAAGPPDGPEPTLPAE